MMSLFYMSSMVSGSYLSVWTGVKVSEQDHVALLVCVALNGYHSVVSYQWSEDGVEMKGETYPLLYTSVCGKHTC